MTLFGRRIIVRVAGLVITQPRISGRIERQADQTQTTGEIKIYNLAPGHNRQIYERGGEITVEAGYPETLASIFEGQMQRVRPGDDDLAHVTHITLGDTVHSKGSLGAFTNRSYDGPVLVRQILHDLVTDLNDHSETDRVLTLDISRDIPKGTTLTDFAWAGASTDALTAILKNLDLRWFEDDGIIRVAPQGRPVHTTATVTISPDTGMIESPEITDDGIEVLSFLNPLVRIGSRIILRSATVNGVFRAVGLRHDFDNWEGAFSTWTDLRTLDTAQTRPDLLSAV